MGIKVKSEENEFDASMYDFQLFKTADDAVKDIKIEIKEDDIKIKEQDKK